MATATRIYLVKNETSKVLVKATSQAQALRHVVKAKFAVEVPNSSEVADLIVSGTKLETAGDAE